MVTTIVPLQLYAIQVLSCQIEPAVAWNTVACKCCVIPKTNVASARGICMPSVAMKLLMQRKRVSDTVVCATSVIQNQMDDKVLVGACYMFFGGATFSSLQSGLHQKEAPGEDTCVEIVYFWIWYLENLWSNYQ